MPRRSALSTAAALLGQRGGSKHTEKQVAARRENGRRATGAKPHPCTCGHGRARHKWQRDGSRAACKDCGCPLYRAPVTTKPNTRTRKHTKPAQG